MLLVLLNLKKNKKFTIYSFQKVWPFFIKFLIHNLSFRTMTDTEVPGNSTDCRDLELTTNNQEDNRLPATLRLDEIRTSQVTSNQVASAIKKLQAYIEPLGSFYTFGHYVKSVKKFEQDGKYKRIIHLGKAKCMQSKCMAKGARNTIAYSSWSRDHLKTHYKHLHGDVVHKVAE